MRAFSVQKFGESPAIHDLPIPRSPDSYLVRITYAGVNPIDYKLVERLKQTSTYPFVLGVDFAGVIEEARAGDSRFSVGDRVFGMSRTHGAYAEFTSSTFAEKDQPLMKIPDSVSDEDAAALPVPGITALGSLDLLELSANQTIVVLGATGAVGGLAVQMAKFRDVHVIAVVRGEGDVAVRLGADEVYDSTDIDIYAKILSVHPEKVDAVLDVYSGPEPIKRNSEILKPGGRLVSTIYAADTTWFAEHQITAQNIASTNNPLSSPGGLDQVIKLLSGKVITTRIREITKLEDAGQTLEKLKKGGLKGKLVIQI